MLHELKFYRSACEDIALAERLLMEKECRPRHLIVLFHDTLEFLIYECLLLDDIDIYENGQNTIGFDKAFNELVKTGYRPCYTATIREIQKLRGDAKHHAQDVDWAKVEQIAQRWQIVCVCLVWDLISPTATSEDLEWAARQYARAQYLLYQRARNKNWEIACRHLMMAVIHKKFNMDEMVKRRPGGSTEHLSKEIGYIEELFTSGPGKQAFLSHGGIIKEHVRKDDWRKACEKLAQLYSTIETEYPTQFDAESAKYITNKLASSSAFRLGKQMTSWCKWFSEDTEGYRSASKRIQELLRSNPALVERFGTLYYEHDGDRCWEWWAFVVFDGEEWHSFHLNDGYQISAESFHPSEDNYIMREKVAKLALKEFEKAVQQSNTSNKKSGLT